MNVKKIKIQDSCRCLIVFSLGIFASIFFPYTASAQEGIGEGIVALGLIVELFFSLCVSIILYPICYIDVWYFRKEKLRIIYFPFFAVLTGYILIQFYIYYDSMSSVNLDYIMELALTGRGTILQYSTIILTPVVIGFTARLLIEGLKKVFIFFKTSQ